MRGSWRPEARVAAPFASPPLDAGRAPHHHRGMFQLVYVSSARALFTAADLAALLAVARVRNAELGVTGMLVYHDGNFMQVLEGDREVVLELSRKIERDPRHHGFLRLLGRELPEREFGEWSMGFVDATALSSDDVDAFSPVLRDPAEAERVFGQPGQARKLLASFRRSVR